MFPNRAAAPQLPPQPGALPQQAAPQTQWGRPAAGTPGAPAFGGVPGGPAVPGGVPGVPMTPPAPVLKFWAAINGAAQPVEGVPALRALPPGTYVSTEANPQGWLPVEQMLATLGPAANVPAAGAPQMPQQVPTMRTVAQPQQQVGGGAPSSGGDAVPRGLFSGMETAQVFSRGNNIEEGDYVIRLEEAIYKEMRGGKKGIILETTVLVSSFDPNDPSKTKCNREGSKASIFIMKNDNFLSNVKEVILALCGFDANGQARPEDSVVSAAESEALVSPAQPFAGVCAYIEARVIMTKGANGTQPHPFTRVTWKPCPVDATGAPNLAALSQYLGRG